MPTKPNPPTNIMRMKIGLVALVICVLCAAVLISRLFYLQIIEGEKYKQMAIDQQLHDTVITPHRGSIFDAKGRTLAKSAPVWNVIFEPGNLPKNEESRKKTLDAIANEETGLPAILGIEGQTIYDRALASPGSYWELVGKKVDKDIADKVTLFIQENDINCVKLAQDTKRFYPYENLASTVLGFVNSTDNTGAYGLESYYNKVLTGVEGRVVSAKNARNGDMPFKYQKLYESQDGNSLVLTLDETVQHFLEKHLEVAVNEHQVKKRATAIAFNVKTGAILGMTTKPDFNPNSPRELKDPLAETRLKDYARKLQKEKLLEAEKARADAAAGITDPAQQAAQQTQAQALNTAPGVVQEPSDKAEPALPADSVVQEDDNFEDEKLTASTVVDGEIKVDTAKLKLIALERGMTEEEFGKWLLDEQNNQWRNKVISDPYEPGSVFKLITAAAALDTGAQTMQSEHYCSGFKMVADNKIHCWTTNGGHGAQNFTQCMMHSCNPAFIEIGQATGVEDFLTYFDRFGLNDITGVDLPGEATGISYNEKTMKLPQLSSSAFGQTFKVTSMQLVTAISAALNGGNLVQPYIVKEIIDADKNIVESYEPQIKRQVVSQKTSEQVRELGEAVVRGIPGDDRASGRLAAIPGYRIGGKTGTSEKLDNFDENGVQYGNVLSFLGFAPADDPEIAVLVALDEPVVGNAQSSTIAAPVVGAMLEDILPYLGYEPSFTAEELAKQEDVTVGTYIASKPHEAQGLIRKSGLKTEIIGNGVLVIKQIPEPGKKVPYGGTVILYTDESESNASGIVPDVVSRNAFDANQMITNAGFNINIEGNSSVDGKEMIVISQTPPAKSKAETGSIITVVLAEKGTAIPPAVVVPTEGTIIEPAETE